MTQDLGTYEYAGFTYRVTLVKIDEKFSHIFLSPVPGQHPAAGKDKHMKNALRCYMEEARK